MRARPIIVVALVATLMLLVASPARGAQQTRILYGLENLDYYTYTPTATGYLQIEVFWQDDTGGTPGYPVAQVDGVCQAWNAGEGEAYWDYDLQGLYANTNPETDVLEVTADMVGKPVYVGVMPFVGDVQYRLVLGWSTAAGGPFSTVTDSGAFPSAHRAHGIDARFYIPAIAGAATPWHSVAIWPGSSGGTQYADVDDYCWNYDYTTTIAENYASTDYYGPLVTDTTIPQNVTDDWFIAAPQIRTAAAVPNDWTGGSIYPKPGTLAYNTAPIWYTYSWGEDAGTSNTAYFWGSVSDVGASRLSHSSSVSTGASIRFKFYGSEVTWVYTKNSAAGVARVHIDGVDKGTVDQYNATTQHRQSTTFGGLSDSAHEIVITNDKKKNPFSSNSFVTHDRFVAPGFSDDLHTGEENNMSGNTLYFNGAITNALASGGSYAASVSTSAALAFTFSGTSVDWKYTRNSAAGVARVHIDGVDMGTVDQYSATSVYQQTTTYSGLAPGLHTIFITNNKTKNEASSNSFITHDAFVVGGTTYEN